MSIDTVEITVENSLSIDSGMSAIICYLRKAISTRIQLAILYVIETKQVS